MSAHDGQAVLVTRYIEGTRADGSMRTFARLGSLLGRLHTLPSDHVRDGGGWHHPPRDTGSEVPPDFGADPNTCRLGGVRGEGNQSRVK